MLISSMLNLIFPTQKTDPNCLHQAREGLSKLRLRRDLGFLELPKNLDAIQMRALEIKKQFKQIVVLGIGGSALGTKALLEALSPQSPQLPITILDNVDEFSFFQRLEALNLAETHFLIISKSGQTIETLTQAELVDQVLIQKGLRSLALVSTVISETTSNPLTDWALRENVPSLEVPKNVGGRFSVLTPVGLLPAALAGFNLQEISVGAHWAKDQDTLISELAAQAMTSFSRKEWITLFWCYCDRLVGFSYWLQQLWAESLAKAKDRSGAAAPRVSTPIPCRGSTDQHSILQQVMQGERDKFIYFFRVQESANSHLVIQNSLFRGQEIMKQKSMGNLFSAQADAIRQSLFAEQVQSVSLNLQKLDESSIGALFMLFQMVIGTLGEVMNIDAFDQPGVESGKLATRRLLSGLKASSKAY